MKKKQLIQSEKPKDSVAKPLCNSNGGSCRFVNWGTGEESDVLL